jgi:hypothetical protein
VVVLGRVGLRAQIHPKDTPTMTDDKIDLCKLLEKGSDTTFLRVMLVEQNR